ncbi:hypothetical protein F5Y05DRAFT_422205 [Hypoxylon sp. FL0543]|nr:hypothetical protein F5Y05DRAFT_422205 [Hypoxylon sp. FL0543]
MSLGSGALELHELPMISSSVAPVSTNSTLPLSSIGTGATAVLPERTRSLHIDGKLISERVAAHNRIPDGRRGRSATPIRAQAKRRRSVASAPGGDLGYQSSRINDSTRPAGGDSSHPNNEILARPPSRRSEVTKEQELPRGRTIRRATSYPGGFESRKRRKLNGESRTSSKSVAEKTERTKNTTKGSEKIVLAPLPLSGDSEQNDGESNLAYERKGAFRLKKRSKGADEFRFPKARSEPEPLWRAGDGFSSDEAKPDFMFLVTSTHKQRTSASLPGIGKLPLEVEDANKENLHGSGISKPKVQRPSKYKLKRLRGTINDVWPNRENFSEELEVRKRNPTVPEDKEIIPSTVLPKSTPEPRARETFSYNPHLSRARKHSDFEHFGQRPGKSDEFHTTSVTRPQTLQAFHIGQPESGDEECEYEEEYETGEDYELVPATDYIEESDEDGEHIISHEDTSGASRSRESSAHDSAISFTKGDKSGLQMAEKLLSDLSTQGKY